MKIVKWDDENIVFSNGSVITYDHVQDCCESNWADFSVLDTFYDGKEFKDYFIEPVDKAGFNLVLVYSAYEMQRIFIPCYSDQNGYYTDEIWIEVKHISNYKIYLQANMRHCYD